MSTSTPSLIPKDSRILTLETVPTDAHSKRLRRLTVSRSTIYSLTSSATISSNLTRGSWPIRESLILRTTFLDVSTSLAFSTRQSKTHTT